MRKKDPPPSMDVSGSHVFVQESTVRERESESYESLRYRMTD